MRSKEEPTSSAQNPLEQPPLEYWLSKIISPELLAPVKNYPAYKLDGFGPHTDAYVMSDIIFGKLVFPERRKPEVQLDDKQRSRLFNVLAVFQALTFPTMTPIEQARSMYVVQASSLAEEFENTSIEINEDLRNDIRWLWDTFGLEKPAEVPHGLLSEGTIINPS